MSTAIVQPILYRSHVRIYNDPLANQNAWQCLGITRQLWVDFFIDSSENTNIHENTRKSTIELKPSEKKVSEKGEYSKNIQILAPKQPFSGRILIQKMIFRKRIDEIDLIRQVFCIKNLFKGYESVQSC